MLRPVETGLWTDATCAAAAGYAAAAAGCHAAAAAAAATPAAAAASAAESDNMTRDRQHDVVEACDRGMWRMSSSEALCSTWSTHGLRPRTRVGMVRNWRRYEQPTGAACLPDAYLVFGAQYASPEKSTSRPLRIEERALTCDRTARGDAWTSES